MAGYNDWVFKFLAFVRVEPGFEEFIVAMEDLTETPTVEDVRRHNAGTGKDASWFDEQLYMMLVNRAIPNSKALSVTRNAKSFLGFRGAYSWHRISRECKGNKGDLRREALRDKAREPAACVTDAEITARIADWEGARLEYEKEFPDERISEYEKGRILKKMMTPEMQSTFSDSRRPPTTASTPTSFAKPHSGARRSFAGPERRCL